MLTSVTLGFFFHKLILVILCQIIESIPFFFNVCINKSEKSLTVTFIAAAQGSSVVPSSAKVDFLKLQNGRYNNVHSFYDLHPLV